MENEEINKLTNVWLKFKDNKRIFFKDLKEENIPKARGCYVVYNRENKPIYVGRTIRLKDRLETHHRKNSGSSSFRDKIKEKFNFNNEEQITAWVEENCSVIYIEIESQEEEHRFEHFLIAILNPELND